MISSNVILEPWRLKEVLDYYQKQPGFVFDVETVGEHRTVPQVNQVTWLSLATHGSAVAIPMGHPNGDVMLEGPRKKKNPVTKKFDMFPARWSEPPKQMRPSEVFGILEPLFLSEDHYKAAHNATFDLLSVGKYLGEIPPGPYHDTIVLAWLINENQRLGLKDLTEKIYKRFYDAEHVGRKVEIHPFSKVGRYSYMDAKYTWLHLQAFLQQIKEDNLTKVYELEMETLAVLLDMGADGMPVDVEAMEALEPVLAAKRVEAEGRVYRAAGSKLNLNSPKQKVDALYGPKSEGGQGLKPWKLTKGGLAKQKKGLELTKYDYSTDAESLEKYSTNPVVSALLDFQEVDRVLGTYIYGYLGHEAQGDKKAKPRSIFDGKVYPDFVQYGTVTGRFSCRAPNLQNIPRPDTELGKQIRSLFIAGEGHKLIVADYGQIELVVLAHFVGRGALYEGFFKGIDPHTMTAALVFNQDPEDLQRRVNEGDPEAKGMRQAAKAINFAVVYGAGPDKVASMAGVTVTRAKQILSTHERQFPEIYAFKDQALKICKQRNPPHLTTIMGRKRRLPSIMARDYSTKGKAERQAINSLIQGTAADIIKVSMVRLNKGLAESDTGGRLLLSVHDELVSRAPAVNAEACADVVREAMLGSGIQELVDVPLSIDLNIVDKWSEAK